MNDAVGCVGRTQRIFVSLLLSLSYSSTHQCLCVFTHWEPNANWKCGKQELRHGHFTQINTCTHPTNQSWQTDTHTHKHFGVFMWNPIKIVPAVRLSSLQVPTPIITQLYFLPPQSLKSKVKCSHGCVCVLYFSFSCGPLTHMTQFLQDMCVFIFK